MSPVLALRIRGTIGLMLALAPALPVFQYGRLSTLRGAIITICATAMGILLAWWTRPDPEFPPRWGRIAAVGIVGGVGVSSLLAYGMGTSVNEIVRYAWVPLLRAIAVSIGICLMLSALEGPMPPRQVAERIPR